MRTSARPTRSCRTTAATISIRRSLNVNWIKGRHNVRFGTDIYYQALNHTQPEISGGDSFGARGGFRFQAGPTQIQGGPGGNLYNAFAAFLLGVPNRIGRLKLVEPYTTRNWQYSLYVRDQWQASSKITLSFGTRWEYFPVPTRATRGLERYNVETNQMMIGGIGDRAEGSGGQGQQDDVRAARRHDLPPSRGDGAARRLRHHQRSLRARQAAAHEPPRGAEPAASTRPTRWRTSAAPARAFR